MNGLTARLLNAVVNGAKPDVSLDLLLIHAGKNKILLHLLRALNIQGSMREQQESGIRKVIEVVHTLSKLLKNYNYAFFKLIKPISYVPADVDILVDESQAEKATHEIMRLGYTIAVKDPYCITLTKGDSIIDLYVHPSLGGMILLNGQKLLEHPCITEFNGTEVRSLKSYAEALVAASHAIYKERIYTLNDYFTVKEWASTNSFKMAEGLSCKPALKLALTLNEKIEKGLIETPYKIPTPHWIALLLQKVCNDKLARASATNIIKVLTKHNLSRAMMAKFMRESY
jgi:hypothetical protein